MAAKKLKNEVFLSEDDQYLFAQGTHYEIYEKTGDLSALKDRYNELLVNRDREVEVLDETHPYTGISEGINEKGELMVRTKEGVKLVSFGEVSVRGIYGYV